MEGATSSKPELSYPSAYSKKPYTPSQRGKEIVASKIFYINIRKSY
jgi:hypothetical protein